MIDVRLSVFRLKGAMSGNVHGNDDIPPRSTRPAVLSFNCARVRWLMRRFGRFGHGGGEGRRRTGNLSLASVATGHSLVAPCGLGNSEEAGGVSQGGGEETPSH